MSDALRIRNTTSAIRRCSRRILIRSNHSLKISPSTRNTMIAAIVDISVGATAWMGTAWMGDSGDGDSVDGDSGDGDVDVDPLDDEPVAAVLPITLLNPVATGRTVSYTLNSGDYAVDPARSKVHNGGTQVIVFDRGGAFGQATYTLQPGTYRFAITDKGMDLRTVTPQVATDQVAEQR